MAHYVYEGQHYELPDGLSNDQAITKIKTHLGQTSSVPKDGLYSKEYQEKYLPSIEEKNKSPAALIPGTPEIKPMTYEEFAKHKDQKLKDMALSPLDVGASLISGIVSPIDAAVRGGVKSLVEGSSFLKNYEDIFKSDIYEPRTEYGQKALEAVAPIIGALPPVGGYAGSLGAMGRNPKPKLPSVQEKLNTMREGESVAPVAEAPKQQVYTPSQLKAWKETQDRFAAYKEEQAALQRQQAAQQALELRQRALEQEVAQKQSLDFNAAERARQEAAPVPGLEEAQARAIDESIAKTQDLNKRGQQLDITEDYGNNDPMSRMPNMRVDENGIPVRSDLSMEAQNLQNPLQRNLWGDEMPGRTGDGGLPLTQALDKMPEGLARDKAMEQLTGIPAKELPMKIMEVLNGERFNKQRGGIDLSNNASGESSASLEALGRLAEEATKGRQRIVIDQYGNTRPLNGVDAVDYRPKRGEIVAQQNVGANQWTILDSNEVKNPQARLNVGLSKYQRGGIDFNALVSNHKVVKKVEELVKSKFYSEKVSPESVVADALASGKDSKGSINFSAGGTLEAEKRQSPLIRGVSRINQREQAIAEDRIRNIVFPVEKLFRQLSKQEITDLSTVLKDEMFTRKPLSGEQLATVLNEKQLMAYSKLRDAFRKTYQEQNAIREMQGLKPITESEAYVSSVWRGDFRSLIKDSNGKTVWALAANTKRGLEAQKKALFEQFPSLKDGANDFVMKSSKKGTTAKDLYSDMLDVLGRDDPAVQQMAKWMEDHMVGESRAFLNQEKHFEQKGNTRGFIGDRPGRAGPGEAIDMVQAQIDYMKQAHQWSALQRAAQDIKKVLNNEDLKTQQPNNMAYAREYWLDQLAANELPVIREFENLIREGGVSPNALYQVVGGAKNLWTTQKLAVNLGFAASNVLQAANMLPHLTDMQVKYGGNPITSIVSGLTLGPLLATGHVFSNRLAKSPEALYKAIGLSFPKETAMFLTKAMKYAEDNSIVSRSVYDESPVASSFNKGSQIMKLINKTVTVPETFLRSVTYMTYVNQLKSSGKFANDMDIFRMADERTNMSMGDYRAGERAPIFNKLGTTGNALSTLTTYPINYYNQWSWALRQSMSGNVAPAIVMLGVQGYLAGLMGVPGFADLDRLLEKGKEWLASVNPLMWNKVKDVSLKDAALHLPGGASLVYGGLSENSGVSFTSRAAAPSPIEMTQTPGAPMADLVSQAGDFASAASSGFMDSQKNAQAVYNMAPTGLQGMLETGPLKSEFAVGDNLYKNKDLASRKGQYSRSPEEEKLRSLGFKSQKEAVTRDFEYRQSKKESVARDVIKNIPDKLYNEIRKGNMDKAKDYITMYAELTGKGLTQEQLANQVIQEFTTSQQRKWVKGAMPVYVLQEQVKLEKLLKDMGYVQ